VYGYYFGNDKSVIHLVGQVMLLITSFEVADGLAGSCGGVFRGQGRQHLDMVFHVYITIFMLMPLPLTTIAHRPGSGAFYHGYCESGSAVRHPPTLPLFALLALHVRPDLDLNFNLLITNIEPSRRQHIFEHLGIHHMWLCGLARTGIMRLRKG
jgi:Na+-driven multidrug efflux pump